MKSLFFLILFFSVSSFAQVHKQKEELVEATPLESFSSKAESWPVDSVPEEIIDVQGSSIYDALNKYPGIQTKGEDSSGSPSIRIRGSGSGARSMILFDGSPINAQDGTGANPLLLPTEMIDSVEILKGPSSLFYGSDAVGGAINLIPKKYFSPLVRVGYESTNKPSVFLATPISKSEKCFEQATAYLEHSGGNYKYDDPSLGNTERTHNDRNKQRYTLLGENKFSTTTISHHFIYAREMGESPGVVPINPTQIVEFDRSALLGSAQVKQKLNSDWNASYKLSGVYSDNENIQNGTKTSDQTSKIINSFSTDYQFLDSSNLEFVTDFSNDTYNSPFVDSKKRDEHFEHALILKSQISSEQYILVGVRFFPDQNESVKNILLKQDMRDYTMWASYSEGIKIPDFTQRLANAPFFTGNPNLRPEHSEQIEIGAEKQIRKTKLKASLYTIDYKDFIQYVFPAAPYSYENVDATTRGFEFSASTDYKIYHGLLSYSYIDSKNEDTGSRMLLTPKHQVYLLLGAQLSAFIFELHNTFWSKYKLDATNDSSGWYTMDLTVRTIEFNDWNFKAGVLNLLGKEREFADGFPEPKTQYFVFAEKSF